MCRNTLVCLQYTSLERNKLTLENGFLQVSLSESRRGQIKTTVFKKVNANTVLSTHEARFCKPIAKYGNKLAVYSANEFAKKYDLRKWN